jgi:hypothetical protein
MSVETVQPTPPPAQPAESSDALLRKFFESSKAARHAAGSLRKSAEVAVRFSDVPGDFRFHVEAGKPELSPGAARDPDFELLMSPGAVRDLCGHESADVGDFGVLFFQHMLAHEPDKKIKVKLHSGLLKLTTRGYLGVLASGGPKVVLWLAQKGLKGPGAVASAIGRLRKG